MHLITRQLILLIEVITSGKVKDDSLDWVASNKPPFKLVDPVDLDEKILNQAYDIYRNTYSVFSKTLFLKNT